MSSERWRIVTGFPAYRVSDMGRVQVIAKTGRSSRVGKFLKPWEMGGRNGNKYLAVGLRPGPKNILLHILILEMFVGPRPDGCLGHHKDGIKKNCKLKNLEWITYSKNNQHAYDAGLRSPGGFCKRRLMEGEIWLMKKILNSQAATQGFVAKMFRCSQGHVSRIKSGHVRKGVI